MTQERNRIASEVPAHRGQVAYGQRKPSFVEIGDRVVLQISSGRLARQFHTAVAAVESLLPAGFRSQSRPVGESVIGRDPRPRDESLICRFQSAKPYHDPLPIGCIAEDHHAHANVVRAKSRHMIFPRHELEAARHGRS